MADALSTLIALLTDNWESDNTDSITPEFRRITDIIQPHFNTNRSWILLHRPINNIKSAGCGEAPKHETANTKFDVRVYGLSYETHAGNVVEECKRILDNNKNSPGTGWTYVEFNGDEQDISDKTRRIWRILLPVQLMRLTVSR